mgnify:CR=1 FL=1
MEFVGYTIKQFNNKGKVFYRDFKFDTWTVEEDFNVNNITDEITANKVGRNWRDNCEILKLNFVGTVINMTVRKSCLEKENCTCYEPSICNSHKYEGCPLLKE